MKKTFLSRWVILIPLFAVISFSSCKKEGVDTTAVVAEQSSLEKNSKSITKPFKLRTDTWYRINPVDPKPISGHPCQLGFVNLPGGGSGNATEMGIITTWFNQLAFSPTGENPAVGTVVAPLLDVLNYKGPFPDAPLPFVQPNDFAQLNIDNAWLQVPKKVNGCIVNSIVYNKKRDAVFLTLVGDAISVVESPIRISFSGKGKFLGGRGKFEKATGTYKIEGYFNPQDPSDAEFSIDGTINY